MGWLDEALPHGSGDHVLWRRSCGVIGEPFQVLHGGGQEELVAGAGEAPQSKPDHREDMLGLAKEPFDLLAFAAGGSVSLGLHQGAGIVARLLVHIAREAALPAGGALGLERTAGTVAALGDVFDRRAVMNGAGGFQFFAAGIEPSP